MKRLFAGTKDELRKRIWDIDLVPIMVKLMDEKEGEGWLLDQAMSAVEEYRRFLYLTAGFPQTIVPTQFVDAVWHAHILDTMKYAEDCQTTFGFFLHHFPYFGMRDAEDQVVLQETFRASASLYEAEFKTSYYVGISGASCGTCGTNCGGQNCTTDVANPQEYRDVVRTNVRPTFVAA